MNSESALKHSASVLIVDQDEHFCVSLGKALHKAGFQSQSVANLGDALDALAHHKYDVILSEFFLPSATAMSLLQHVRSNQPHCRVIIMTAYYDEKIKEQCLNAGAFACIPKPIKKDFLLNILHNALMQ